MISFEKILLSVDPVKPLQKYDQIQKHRAVTMIVYIHDRMNLSFEIVQNDLFVDAT